MTQTAETPPISPTESKTPSISAIKVHGFKSFAQEATIELGGLTILAGVNSSGKSSIMQPLLLMKQTLEAPYDPGALLLDGPNVHFTSGEQLLSRSVHPTTNQWSIEIEV
jgi:predicted ATPase